MNTKLKVIDLCKEISLDRNLVQGAGGNCSWKNNDKMFVKASGTWLKDADKKDIFILVDLQKLNNQINKNKFPYRIESLQKKNKLRPSIETLLHALMPQKIVFHLHPVELVSVLIRRNSKNIIQKILKNKFNWGFVKYSKPGPELAMSVKSLFYKNPNLNIIFLQNHGIVIGESDVEKVRDTLYDIIKLFKQKILFNDYDEKIHIREIPIKGYEISPVSKLNNLSTNKEFQRRLKENWAICPDHVVFLGPKAKIISEGDLNKRSSYKGKNKPAFIFVSNRYTLISKNATTSQKAQLDFYYNVISRQDKNSIIENLNKKQINELLEWDAEKYRQNLSKV